MAYSLSNARVAELVDAADLKSAGASRAGSIPAPGTPIARFCVGMTEREPPVQGEDLARWARELGVSYEELASTLNYAGPTFKDLTFSSDARRAGSTSIPS